MSNVSLPNRLSSRLSFEDCQELAVQVLKSCGYGRLLLIGVQDPDLISELLRHGVDVTGVTASPEILAVVDAVVPGRVRAASATVPLHLEWVESFETVIFLVGPAIPDLWTADVGLPRRLLQLGHSIMVVLLENTNVKDARVAWDERFDSAGGRRHPLSLEVAPYSSLDALSGKALLLYEGVPDASMEGGRARGFGAEAEACAAQYGLAAKFVRPSDRVLDIAPLGDLGPYLLSSLTAASIVAWSKQSHVVDHARAAFVSVGNANLIVEQAPQDGIRSVASDSFDFIVADGDLEESELAWIEAKRVLTPGGRFYVCSAVRGGAGTGLVQAIRGRIEASGLLLERSWLQRAYEPTRAGVGGRCIEELRPEDMTPVEGDWVIFLAMKSVGEYRPDAGQVVREEKIPNVIAFSRDYENPWLVRGLVSMGLRATSVSLRILMAEEVLAKSSEQSVDHGAALCVRCYAELESETDVEALHKLMQRALNFSELPARNPTAFRWQISLMFAAGLMAQRIGDLVLAESIFLRIGDRDALKFSPLLGTKTIGAAFRCGTIAFARGDNERARLEWTRAILETRRLLREGDWREIWVDSERPETFGLPEVAAFVMEGARAVGGLRALQDYPDKPSLVWQALHSTQLDAVQSQDLELRLLRRWYGEHDRDRNAWIDELVHAKAWLSQQLLSWQAAAGEKDEQIRSLTDQLTQLGEGKAWVEQQLSSWQADAGEKDEQIHSLTDRQTQLDEGKAWIEQQLSSWQAAAGEKDGQIHSLTDQLTQLGEGKAWVEQQLSAWQLAAGEKDEQIHSLTDRLTQLDEGKAWIEQQLSAWQAAAGEKDEQIHLLADHLAQLGEGKAWIEQQLSSWQAAAGEKDAQLQSLADQLSQLNEAKAWLVQELSAREVQVNVQASRLNEFAGQVSQMRDNIARLSGDNSSLLLRRQQCDQRILAMQGEIRTIARTSSEESRRLRSIESSRFVRLGRKLGLIQIRE